jgi:hypothetical protein
LCHILTYSFAQSTAPNEKARPATTKAILPEPGSQYHPRYGVFPNKIKKRKYREDFTYDFFTET